jgi:hypothetical protein
MKASGSLSFTAVVEQSRFYHPGPPYPARYKYPRQHIDIREQNFLGDWRYGVPFQSGMNMESSYPSN